MSQALEELLLSAGLLQPDQLRDAKARQRGRDVTLAAVITELGFLDETTLARANAKAGGLPFVDLTKGRVNTELTALLPPDMAREQRCLPVIEKGATLVIAVDDPQQRILADQLQFQLGRDVTCALCAPSALTQALADAYGEGQDEAPALVTPGAEEEEGDAPVVRLVSRTFADALKLRASDIHIEPMMDRLVVRYRIDGVLRVVAEHPLHLAAPLLSRLKVMGQMDIAEKRKPQDGRISMTVEGRQIDVRASILPSNHGESIVMRLLDKGANLKSLTDLGFDGEDRAWFSKLIGRPNGIVLVTGPTGSGKTTTLYAALSELNRPDVKLITAEDPVEYRIPGINQVQVQPKVGLTFARILRAMLRSAPNVILVGEIRDLETAEVAIQAALTGHLVFSTLHTNDAPSALTRLIDMGVPAFLASAAVQGVLAQRLVRRLCPDCRVAVPPTEAEAAALGLDFASLEGQNFHEPGGCTRCEGTGYRGRVGLFELLELDASLRELVFQGASLERLRAQAESTGRLRGLLEDGARKVIAGHTSVEEVLRVARAATSLEQAV